MRRLLLGSFLVLVSFSMVFAGNTVSVIGTDAENGSAQATIGINLENSTYAVGGVQLDLVDVPDTLDVVSVTPVGRAAAFDVSYDTLTDGSVRILLYDDGEKADIEVGDGNILDIVYNITGISDAIIGIDLVDVLLSDPAGMALNLDDVFPGNIFIGTYAELVCAAGAGDAGEGDYLIPVSMRNTGAIAGIQMDFICNPPVLYIDSVKTPLAGFDVSYSIVGSAVRVLLFDDEGTTIPASDDLVDVISLYLSVDDFAVAQDVEMSAVDVLVSSETGTEIPAIVTGNVFEIVNGYLYPPVDLSGVSGLDGAVPLLWAPPGGGAGDEELVEGFEGPEYPVGWAMIDNDGGTNSQFGITTNWMFWEYEPHGGTMAIGSVYNDGALPNDDWMITPMVIPGSTTELRFWASPQDPDYSNEIFDVKVSTESQDITTFGESLLHYEFPAGTGGTPEAWEEFVVDLSEFSGQEIFVAIQCVSIDQFILKIDDLSITELHEVPDLVLNTGLREHPSMLRAEKRGIESYTISHEELVSLPRYNKAKEDILDAYNIYRSETSPVAVDAANLIASVGSGVVEYTDSTVTNSVTYNYVVTAGYANRESGPSNEIAATPVEWVDLSIESGEAYSGDTLILNVSLENIETAVAGFEFSVQDIPDVVEGIGVTGTDRLTGGDWSVSGQEQVDGSYKVLGFDMGGNLIAAGAGPIVEFEFVIKTLAEPVEAELNLLDIVISDQNSNELPATPHGGNLNVLVETQYVIAHGDQANPGDSGEVAIEIVNSLPVAGFQFILKDVPDCLTAVEVLLTERVSEIEGGAWSLSGSEQDDGTFKVLAFDFNNKVIVPGDGPVAIITYAVAADAELGEMDILVQDVVLSDAVGNPLYVEAVDGHFGVGEPDIVYTLLPDTFEVGGAGSITVAADNKVELGGFQFDVMDSADVLLGTGVSSSLSGWTVSGNELPDGSYRLLVFSMSGGTIPAGSTTTFEIDVEVDSNAVLGDYPIFFADVGGAYPDGNTAWAVGNATAVTIVEAEVPPEPFALLSPDDGSTWVHNYDFLEGTETETFTWEESVDPNGEAVTYGFVFGSEGYGEVPAAYPSDNDGADPSLTIPVKTVLDALFSLGVTYPQSGTFYWYVNATDGDFAIVSIDTFEINIEIETGIGAEGMIPEEFELLQNYPNPFNPETSISYGLPQDANVKLEVYNLLGQKIVSLVSEKQNAGYHSVKWGGQDMFGKTMKSGVYIYRIIAGEFTETRKMMLLK